MVGICILIYTVANKNYLIQIETNYKKNFDNYYDLFTKNLVEFYEAQTIHIQTNQANIAQLITKERFLKDIKIINFKKHPAGCFLILMLKLEYECLTSN